MCPIPAAPEGQPALNELRPLNHDYHRRLRKRLRDNPEAVEFLRQHGLSSETVAHFGLGLSLPYASRKVRLVQADALVYPVIGIDGAFYSKYGYYNIPGVTRGPEHAVGWAHGEPRACYAEAPTTQTSLFICERADEMWLLWQSIQNSRLASELLPATTTHGAAFPAEWADKDFWRRWEQVYCSYPDDELHRVKVTEMARVSGRYICRVPAPKDGSGRVTFIPPRDPETLACLLKEGLIVSPDADGEAGLSDVAAGRLPYDPININGAYHNGHLYYPVRVLRREAEIGRSRGGEETARYVERLETVVVRSDRSAHTAAHTPAPRGTGEEERVLRLTDGTLIDRAPRPNRFATWSWASIKSYLDGRADTRTLGEILRDVLPYLKSAVALPRAEDYALLALAVPVTYAQAVFDHVPLIHVCGPASSGKSALGRAMADLCANAYLFAQAPVRWAAQAVDEARGLTVVDDADRLTRSGAGGAGHLIRALVRAHDKGATYCQATGVQSAGGGALRLYGVKVVVSRQGFAGVPAGASIRIRTRRLSATTAEEYLAAPAVEGAGLARLRDELHTWTFEHAETIASYYRNIYTADADLFGRVAAPLRVMAALSADEALLADLELALGSRARAAFDHEDPEVVLRHAVNNLIRQGYRTISTTHLALEMRRLLAEAAGATHLPEFPEWATPEWAGRALRRLGLVGPAKERRARLHGANLRFCEIRPPATEGATGDHAPVAPSVVRGPTDFCGACAACVYDSAGCAIKARRGVS